MNFTNLVPKKKNPAHIAVARGFGTSYLLLAALRRAFC